MPAEQIATRMISSLGRVELQKLRSGRLEEADWPRINSAVALLSQQSKLFIDDTPGLTPSELRARARRLKREHGLSMILVDYIQLMQLASSSENRATEISEISRSLKGLAKELNVPVIVLFFGFVLVYDGLFGYLLYRKLARYRRVYRATRPEPEPDLTIDASEFAVERTEFEE